MICTMMHRVTMDEEEEDSASVPAIIHSFFGQSMKSWTEAATHHCQQCLLPRMMKKI